MIRQYVDEALKMARYDKLDGDTFYGEVPRLRGVMATASTLERCREQLAEVIEEWVLIRVAKRLPIPRLGNARSASKDLSRAAFDFTDSSTNFRAARRRARLVGRQRRATWAT